MQAPPEQLGSFYLGAEYDLQNGKRIDNPVTYDARDLVTHAVCVGMTGSGKTGLCIGLLEEAAMDKVPGILIDPKGDITNLLLQFPDLQPADFRPWVNEDDARRKGKTAEEFAQSTSESWKNGLADWGITGERIKMLNETVQYTIFTPGSDMGIPLNILGSLAAPKLDWATEAEAIRERIGGTVAALLGLAGSNADPMRSREGILLANIFEYYWQQGQDLDLAKLILSIQKPPVRQMGVFDVDTFFPEKDRFQLAMDFNTLVASPKFQTWLQGEPLDVDRLFYDATGKPRHSIIYIAHLSDTERMFIVTLLLENLITWMRRQSGTTSLRALLYFDEVFGYFPPTAEPPSKRPLLTLLKQARAFGLGVVLVTQNPVDIDYKGLTNAGTWFIGKLQAERDKDRVLTGLKGALSEAGQSTEVDYDTLITRLGSRVFLMHNVNQKGPVTFNTRWAMSYLRGPLTLPQVRTLMADRKAKMKAPPPTLPSAAAVAAAPASSTPATAPVGATAASEPAGPVGYMLNAPAVASGVSQAFLPIVTDEREAIRQVTRDSGGGQITVKEVQLLYDAGILGLASTRFADPKLRIEAQVDYVLLAPARVGLTGVDWGDAEKLSIDTRELQLQPEVVAAGQGPFFAPLPEVAGSEKKLAAAAKDLSDWLYYNGRLSVSVHEALGLARKPGESDRDFSIRLQQAARERRDAEMDKLRKQFEPQVERLADRLDKEQQELAQDEAEVKARQGEQLINIGESVLGMFMGRRSSRALSSAASKWNRAGAAAADVEESKQTIAKLTEEKTQLEQELKTQLDEIAARWEHAADALTTTELKPRRSDIDVEKTVLGWLPMWQIRYDDAGRERAATVAAYLLPKWGERGDNTSVIHPRQSAGVARSGPRGAPAPVRSCDARHPSWASAPVDRCRAARTAG